MDCKKYGHMKHQCPNKEEDKKKDVKRKKVLKSNIESDNEEKYIMKLLVSFVFCNRQSRGSVQGWTSTSFRRPVPGLNHVGQEKQRVK